jgi:L-lactate dehydrogenase
LAAIVHVVLNDQRSILTVCTPVVEVVGVADVTLSLPHLVGGSGVLETFPPSLWEQEQALLHTSAEIIRGAIDSLEAGQD